MKRGGEERTYNAMDGELEDQESSADETNNLVAAGDDQEAVGGRSKKYTVSAIGVGTGLGLFKCTRIQWLCLVLGSVVVLTLLCLVVGIGVGLGVGGSGGQSSSSGSDLWKNVRLPSSITPEG